MTAPPPAPTLPDSPADWPPVVRRYVAHLAIQKLLELHDGWYGLVEYLYRGKALTGTTKVSWSANVRTIWPTLLEESEAFEAERQAAKS